MTKEEWTAFLDLATAYYRLTGEIWALRIGDKPKITVHDEVLLELYQDKGMSCKDIADIFGVSETAVKNGLKRQKVDFRKRLMSPARKERKSKELEKLKERNTAHYRETGELLPAPKGFGNAVVISTSVLVEMYEQGMTCGEIAEALGCKRGTVNAKLKKAGVKMRTSGNYWQTERAEKYRENLKKVSEENHRRHLENRIVHGAYDFGGPEKVESFGHIYVYVPNHPYVGKTGWMPKHRLIMEWTIGRYLLKNEVVHHINFDPADNRIENLCVMNKWAHIAYHNKLRKEGKRPHRRESEKNQTEWKKVAVG